MLQTNGMKHERFFQYLEYEKRFSEHTLKAYRNDLEQFSDFLGKIYDLSEPTEIQHSYIRSWMVDLLKKGNTIRSINRKLSCLRTWFKFLREQGEITTNPMLKVIAPKAGKRLPVFVSEKSMSFLFEEVDFGEGFSGIRNRLILELLYCTGMRRSELAALKISDIDRSKNQVKVRGKGNKERLIPLMPHLDRLIGQYLAEKKRAFPQEAGNHLLLSDAGEPLPVHHIYVVVKHYLSLVTTVEQQSPHVLRHTFATHMLNKGADLNSIKKLLGHSSLAATQVYTHNSIERLKKIYEQAHPKATLPPPSD